MSEKLKWISLHGKLNFNQNKLIFNGNSSTPPDGSSDTSPTYAIGTFLCNEYFDDGTIKADIKFAAPLKRGTCEILLSYNPHNHSFYSAGISTDHLTAIRRWDESKQWAYFGQSGSPNSIEENTTYEIKVTVKGSNISLSLNDVELASTLLPNPLSTGQIGIWCLGNSDIEITNFEIYKAKLSAFVVMEFSETYNDVYYSVIKNVCEDAGMEVLRIDETKGPGFIISDVQRRIENAKVIIADITPINPNVFYEVGMR